MDPFLIPQVIDLAGENPAKTYRQPLAAGDSAAHRWEVRVVRAGAAADLTGCSAAVLARREGEDSSPTVRQRAEIAGNVASAEFIPEVYALGGRILAMMVISGGDGRVITAAVLRLQGKTYTTDTICDPEGTIPSLEALLSRYEDMVAATGESRAATQAAQQATEETRAALRGAQTALATAQQAVTDAQGALSTAQTAADTANAAAVKIDAMTVSATPLSAGTATAELTTVDGHYHLSLGLPKGDTGATPQISVQVTTGAAGSEASVSVSGTAEDPVIHLTIPRGDTGAIENMTINGKPVESGTITLTPEDLGAATAESVSQLKNDKLDKTGTAADASKLGGKAPEYYLQPRNLLDNSDFTNPVNQRNAGTVVNDYVVDRWYGFKTTDGSVSITPDGITATGDGYIQHRLPSGTLKSGVVYTIAVYYSDGSIDVNTNGEYAIMDQYDVVNNIKPNGKTIAHVALYEGSYTAETLPPYVPKGYSAELAECQRYYQIIWLYRHPSTIYDNEYRYYGCPLPVKMRAKPAVTIIIMEEFKVNSFDKNILTSYSGESYSSFEGMAISFICKSEFGTVLSQCYVSAKIACTADL